MNIKKSQVNPNSAPINVRELICLVPDCGAGQGWIIGIHY